MGHCDTAPVAEVGHHYVDRATPDKIAGAVRRDHIHADVPDYCEFQRYIEDGGYRLLRRFELEGQQHRPDQAVLDLLAAQRGRPARPGRCRASTGRKWEFVRKEPQPRYLAVNADEGEPGTFKDRHYLERDPHRFLEGVLIAAWSIEAEAAYIYLRDEYPRASRPAEGDSEGRSGRAGQGRLSAPAPWCRRLQLAGRRVRDA